ncbi:hypothetical protein VPNG_07165 [Cytospora leucostoma]|uniref:Major facilitator superfamily (MFS) profile domain-containing protein n=1 Tax=Cytospora leucostoma TaxID=1230097 RepID=A0A423WJP4_9PEZI|nr:hypothetical protein VPNG_07165 [Cytospora leucostoma]
MHTEEAPPANLEPEAMQAPKDTQLDQVTGVKLVILLSSLALSCLLLLLDTSIVSTAIPKITDDFHSLPDVGWYGSAYQLGSSALQLLTGKIYNQFSLKWTFLTFFAVFELGSALCGAAQSSAMLIVGRVVAGIGASALMNGTITIISASVPLEKRPFLLGILMGIAQLGVVLGPLVGGAFTTGYTWRWCFYLNLPLGTLVALPIVLLHIPNEVPKKSPGSVLQNIHHHLDLLGFALFAPAIVMLLLALQFGGNEYPWNSSQVIGLFCGAGAIFIVWMVWNYHKGADALLPVAIIRRRVIWMSGVNYTFLLSTLFGASYFLPIYFQAVKGVSAVLSGVYLLATILPQLLSAVIGGTLVSKIGRVPPMALFSATLTTVGSGLYSLFTPGSSTGEWVGFQVITGLGRGIGLQMPIVAAQNSISQDELSPTMAFLVWCQYIGPAIFLALYNTVFDTSLKSQLREQASNADAAAIIDAGATGFRSIVEPQDLRGVLRAYTNSLDNVFYLVAGAGAVSWLCDVPWPQDIEKFVDELLCSCIIYEVEPIQDHDK